MTCAGTSAVPTPSPRRVGVAEQYPLEIGVERLYQVPRWFTRVVCAVALTLTLTLTWAIVTGMLMMTGLASVAVGALLTTVVAHARPSARERFWNDVW